MSPEHLTPETLRRLLEKDNDEDQNRLLLHHLEACPECREVGGHVAELYRSGAIDLKFSVVDVDLALSRSQARGLWESLRGLTPDERTALIRTSSRFTTWGMAELLCDESYAAVAESPRLAVELASLAVWISLHLPEWQPAEEAWTIELRAYSLAHLGHALRQVGEPLQADCAFTQADRLWESVVYDMGDVLGYEGRVQELLGEEEQTSGRAE